MCSSDLLTFADPIEVVLEPSFSTDTVTVATVLPSKTEDAMPPHAGVGVAPVAFWTQTSNFVTGGGFAEPAVLEGFEHARQSRVKPRGMRRLFVPSGESRDGRGREEEQPGEGSDHGGTGRADYSRYSG